MSSDSGANLLKFYIISPCEVCPVPLWRHKGTRNCWCGYSSPIRIGLFYQQDVWKSRPFFICRLSDETLIDVWIRNDVKYWEVELAVMQQVMSYLDKNKSVSGTCMWIASNFLFIIISFSFSSWKCFPRQHEGEVRVLLPRPSISNQIYFIGSQIWKLSLVPQVASC